MRSVAIAAFLSLCTAVYATSNAAAAATSATHAPVARRPLKVRIRENGSVVLNGTTIQVTSEAGLRTLTNTVSELLREPKANSTRPSAVALADHPTDLRALGPAELAEFFKEPAGIDSRKTRVALETILAFAQSSLQQPPSERARTAKAIFEVASAIENNGRHPVKPRVDIVDMPFVLASYVYNPVGHGRTPARNLPQHARNTDLSQLDPAKSTFWQRQTNVAGLDLYAGFGRAELPRFDDRIWIYDAPKTSYGTNPGFEARAGDIRLKVKFGEIHSEPFVSRIFAALGYNVDPTDFSSGLKLKYDRRFFREFHLRKEISVQIRAAGLISLKKLHYQQRFDPFDFVSLAVLHDGTQLTGRELKARLLRATDAEHPEDDPASFLSEVEQQIDYLVTVPANVQIKSDVARSIGAWDFGQLDHADRRELRGLGLLAAWLAWYDSRFDNTRLKVINTPDGPELKHFITDLGGALGAAGGLLGRQSEAPNLLLWSFTGQRADYRRLRLPPLRIVGYQPMDETPAFRRMTLDDARWMGRLIGSLKEEQIVQALIASGVDAATVRLLAEKLVARRDAMVRDVDLLSEIALIRTDGVDRSFSYDPARQGPVQARRPNGQIVSAHANDHVVKSGQLVQRTLDDVERHARKH